MNGQYQGGQNYDKINQNQAFNQLTTRNNNNYRTSLNWFDLWKIFVLNYQAACFI